MRRSDRVRRPDRQERLLGAYRLVHRLAARGVPRGRYQHPSAHIPTQLHYTSAHALAIDADCTVSLNACFAFVS